MSAQAYKLPESQPPWMADELWFAIADGYSFRYTDAERSVYRRRKRVPVSEWAERHRVITRGPYEGARWRNELVPYAAGIMDASFYPGVNKIVICAAPQTGKSTIIDTCIAYAMDRAPGPVLYCYPDEDTATENVQDRIIPMIRKSPRLRSYLTGVADDETARRINLLHMQIYMAWARSASKLANKSIKYAVGDEVDKYPESANKRETGPVQLLDARLTWYRNVGGKTWLASTPTVEDAPIWQALEQDAEVVFDFWARCPDCGEEELMAFDQIRWPEGERNPKRVETEDLASYVCSHCGCVWDDEKRNVAVKGGRWRARDDESAPLFRYLDTHRPRTIGFHLPSWISRMVTLSSIAASFLRGLHDTNELKDWNNKHAAQPWRIFGAERKLERIMTLKDDRPRGQVPGGGVVSVVTAGVDTQDHGFWFEIRAWGYGIELESWQIREGFVETWEGLFRVLFPEKYDSEDPAPMLYRDQEGTAYPVRIVVQDAMGHRTAEVYDAARLWRGRLFPLQGKDHLTTPYRFSNIENYPGTKKPIPGGVQLCRADVTYFKNQLAGKLEVTQGDPGAWNLHAETTEEYGFHMMAEQQDEKGLWVCPSGRANHLWDCGVYNLVAAEILGVRMLRKPNKYKKKAQAEQSNPQPRQSGGRPGGGYKRPSWLNR